MSIVVSDTSPVRALRHVNQFELVSTYFAEVLIPPAVANELEHPSGRFEPIVVSSLGAVRILAPADSAFVQRLLRDVHRGEADLRTGLGFYVSDRFYESFLRSVGE